MVFSGQLNAVCSNWKKFFLIGTRKNKRSNRL